MSFDALRKMFTGQGGRRTDFELKLASGKTLVLKRGQKFTPGDLPDLQPQAANGLVAEVTAHPQDASKLGLKNLSQSTWSVAQPAGDSKKIETGRSIVLADGIKITFARQTATVFGPGGGAPARGANQPGRPGDTSPGAARQERGLAQAPAAGKLPLLPIVLAGVVLLALLGTGFAFRGTLFGWLGKGDKTGKHTLEWVGKPPKELLAGDKLVLTMRASPGDEKTFKYEYRTSSGGEWKTASEGKVEINDVAIGTIEVSARAADEKGLFSKELGHSCVVTSVDKSTSPDLLMALGETRLRARRWDDAISVFSRVLELSPPTALSAKARLRRGQANAGKRTFSAAIVDYDAALAADRELGAVYAHRGWAWFGRYDEARATEDWKLAAQKITPATEQDYFDRAMARYGLAQLGQPDRWTEALADFDKAISMSPQRADFLAWRGKAHVDHRQYNLALADFREALKVDPKFKHVYAERGWACAKKFDYQLAASDFREYLALPAPTTAEEFYDRGRCQYGLARYGYDKDLNFTPAVADFSQALEREPGYAEALCYRGKSKHEQQDTPGAQADFDQAILIYPRYADAIAGRGGVRRTYKERIDDYTEAIRLRPLESDYYRSRGVTYRNSMNPDQAVADYRQAVKVIEGEEAWDCTQRAFVLNELGFVGMKRPEEFEKAIAECNKAIARDATVSAAFEERGWAYMQKGQLAEAIADFTSAIRLEPKNTSNFSYRAQTYIKQEQFELAVKDYSELIRLQPLAASYYTDRAVVLEKLGRTAEAKADRDKAVELSKR